MCNASRKSRRVITERKVLKASKRSKTLRASDYEMLFDMISGRNTLDSKSSTTL